MKPYLRLKELSFPVLQDDVENVSTKRQHFPIIGAFGLVSRLIIVVVINGVIL